MSECVGAEDEDKPFNEQQVYYLVCVYYLSVCMDYTWLHVFCVPVQENKAYLLAKVFL